MKSSLRMGDPERQLPYHWSTVMWLGPGLLLALVVVEFFASSSAPPAGAALGAAAVAATPVAASVPVGRWASSTVTYDYSAISQHSTAHDSDQPGASIAAYEP